LFSQALDQPITEIALAKNQTWAAGWMESANQIWVIDLVENLIASKCFLDDCRCLVASAGRYLASGGRSIKIWRTPTWDVQAEFRGQDEDVPSLAFSPDERILAVARTDGPVEFWDVQSGKLTRRYEWNIGRLGAIAFAPDGLTCAVAGDRGRIVIWDVDD